jgi:hypothetical protein
MSEHKYYNYMAKHFLLKNIDHIKPLENYISINLCIYSINTDGNFPFLQYVLSNNGYNILLLPKLPVYKLFDKENLISYSKVYLSGLLKFNNFEEINNNTNFDGFYEYNDDLYLFFDITKCKKYIDENILFNNVRFCLIDEIINNKNMCNTQIDNTTSMFFIKNESLIYLYDENNKLYEIPIVGYVGNLNERQTNFIMIFGVSAKNKSAMMGPFYYFTNFTNAISQHNNEKSGLVRFALFIGLTKYVENSPNDPIDESEIKKNRLQDDKLDRKKEILTLRISDHDGIWAKTFDSVHLGYLELDDGSLLDDTPMYILKNYGQQIPLTSHFI